MTIHESPVAYVDIIYHHLLGSVTRIDEEEYTLYANMNTKKRIATWRRHPCSQENPQEEGYYEMTLQVSPPRFYIHEEWHGPSAWEEETVYRLILLPPRYPPPDSRWFDARKLGINARCVYLQDVMGKVEIDENFRGPRGRVVARWTDFHSYAGWFENTLHLRKAYEFVLERAWKPRRFYAGSGRQVYLITVEEVRG